MRVKITIHNPLLGSIAFGNVTDYALANRETIIVLSMEDAKALWAELGHTIRAKKVTE